LKPEDVVQHQLDAYNARDLARFLAHYREDILAYRPPAVPPAIVGKDAFARFYAEQRFNLASLHAELVNRMVIGTRVIDHERISGVREQPFEVAVVYDVDHGLIARTWTFASG